MSLMNDWTLQITLNQQSNRKWVEHLSEVEILFSRTYLSFNQGNILRFDIKETTFKFGHFTTNPSQFFAKYINNFHKTLDADGHFEVLNMSKSQLNQKLQHKTQIFLIQFFFNFGKKNPENLWLINGHFLNILGHFLPTTWKPFTKLGSRQSFWGG